MVYRIGLSERNLEPYVESLFKPETGIWASLASWLGLGARVQLEKALQWLAQAPKDVNAQKAFYQAFKARIEAKEGQRAVCELPIAADVAAVVSTILKQRGIDQQPILSHVAEWYMRDRVNSPQIQTLSMVQVPKKLEEDVKVWTGVCAGYFSSTAFENSLKKAIRQEFEQNGFMSSVLQEKNAIELAQEPAARSTQVAERIRAKHTGLSHERKQLIKLDGAFIASSSQFAQQVKQLEQCVESKSKEAVEYFQDYVVSLFSTLAQDVEGLIAAGQEVEGVNLSSLKYVRGHLERGLHALQTQSLTVARVKKAVEETERVLALLESSLDSKQGIFVAADRPYWFSGVCASERSQVKRDIAALKKPLRLITQYLHVADVAQQALEKKRMAREEDNDKIKELKQEVDEGERFLRLPLAKQQRAIEKEYDDELLKRQSGVSAVTDYLYIRSRAEQVMAMGLSATKNVMSVAAVVLIGAAIDRHASKVNALVQQALSTLPQPVSDWIKQSARPLLHIERAITEWRKSLSFLDALGSWDTLARQMSSLWTLTMADVSVAHPAAIARSVEILNQSLELAANRSGD